MQYQKNPDEVEAAVESLRETIVERVSAVESSYLTFEAYCNVFKYRKMQYEGGLIRTCSNNRKKLKKLRDFYARVKETSFGVYHDLYFGAFDAGMKFSKNWITSLTYLLNESYKSTEIIENFNPDKRPQLEFPE